jgi:hypothetical protein
MIDIPDIEKLEIFPETKCAGFGSMFAKADRKIREYVAR